MKKKILLLFALIFILPFFLFGCENSGEALSSYFICASYDDDQKKLSCSQMVEYVNNSDNMLDEVCFYLYANSFNEGQKTVSTANFNKAYPNGESFGGIEFDQICVNGQAGEFSFENENSILSVTLDQELYPQEVVTIEMEYTIALANINHRLGFGDDTVNFGNFFPIACVYEDGFVKNGFAVNGDPFYSDVANFEVVIECENDFVVASSGVQEKVESLNNSRKRVCCSAPKVRDFCFVLSKKFETVSKVIDGVEVKYFYYDDENAQHHLETSVKALQTFSNCFGEYPYKQLSIVKNNFCYGGMEYPNLVMISDDITDEEMFDYCIVHEIAHQWWYGLVGNNEFSQAWVDEGLTEFSTALFFEKNAEYGVQYANIMAGATETYRNFVKIFTNIYGDVDERLNRTLSEFATEPEYVNCAYTKGMLLFDSLRSTLKDRKFFKCLRNYYETYKYQNVTAEKMIESFTKFAGINLQSFFASWINGEVMI